MTSAGWEALKHPQMWAAPDLLGDVLQASNTELINRPGIGYSEYAGCLENLHTVIQEGVASKIFHPEFGVKIASLFQKYDLINACQTLNSSGYPLAPRSSADMSKAVASVLKFSQQIRMKWDEFSEVFGRACSLVVDLSWALQAGALTNGPLLAPKFADVPMKEEALKKAFMENPFSVAAMKGFLTSEILAQNGLKAEKESAAAKPFVAMNFDDDLADADAPEDEAVAAPAPETDPLLQAAKNSFEALMALREPHGKSGAAPSQKKLVKVHAELVQKTTNFTEAYNALGDADAATSEGIDICRCKSKDPRSEAEAQGAWAERQCLSAGRTQS